MDWYQKVFELIDMRSFSNLWFWIALAVVWSAASHRVLGVPFDMVIRARRKGGEAQTDLEQIVQININRMLYISQVSGLLIMGFVMFGLTSAAILGFYYWVEIAQALFLLALPMSFVAILSLKTAKTIHDNGLVGESLRKKLTRHRLYIQIIGIIAIFVTSMFGMLQNMSYGPLG